MGSSSRKGRGSGAPPAPVGPDAIAKIPGGNQAYYSNPAMVPAAGGMVRPPQAAPGTGGPMPGAGLNFVQPGQPGMMGGGAPQRQSLAQMMYSDMMRRTNGGGNMRNGGGGSPGSYTTSGRSWSGGPSSARGGGGLY